MPDSPSDPTLPPDTNTSPRATKTRTLAIIKPHALKHRLTIEPRIIEAGFEIIKERMMQFDPDSDIDYLNELFGSDALTLIGEPIWVYVLERHRAIEVWNTLMGDPDPDVARENGPHSLRAIYGKNIHENAVAGPPDIETADNQISALFASSPVFPPIDSRANSLRSVASSILSKLRDAGEEEREINEDHLGSDEGYSHSIASTAGKAKPANSRRQTLIGNISTFKARPVPSTTRNPTSMPRTTRAAALRAGVELPTISHSKQPITDEIKANTFENVPGHKRSETIKVASTAEPAIAPRLTKAASLRIGGKAGIRPSIAPIPPRPSTADGRGTTSFEGVPGHKRRETISVASTKVPTVAPRSNRSAFLRQQKDLAPPSSFMFNGFLPSSKPLRPASAAAVLDTVSEKRRVSIAVASTKAPVIAPRLNRSALLRVSKDSAPPSSYTMRGSSAVANGPIDTSADVIPVGFSCSNSTKSVASFGSAASSNVEQRELKKVPLVRKPSIEPRTNRSAVLRANLKENVGTTSRNNGKKGPINGVLKTVPF